MNSIHGLLLGVAIGGCTALDAAPSRDASPDHKIDSLAPVQLAPSTALNKAIATYFGGVANQRTYIQTDKPLYQPGETIWFRADLRAAKTMVGEAPVGVMMQLLSPRGAVVASKHVLAQ